MRKASCSLVNPHPTLLYSALSHAIGVLPGTAAERLLRHTGGDFRSLPCSLRDKHSCEGERTSDQGRIEDDGTLEHGPHRKLGFPLRMPILLHQPAHGPIFIRTLQIQVWFARLVPCLGGRTT